MKNKPLLKFEYLLDLFVMSFKYMRNVGPSGKLL